MKRLYTLLLGCAGIAAAVAWSVHGVNFSLVSASLSAIRYPLLTVVLLLTSLNLLIRAAVWRTIVLPLKKLSIHEAFTTYLLGVFSNIFLPLKLGDMVQGYGLSRRGGINPVSAVSAVMVQRIAEAATLLLLMTLISFVFSFPVLSRRHSLVLATAVAGCLTSLFGLYALRRPIETISGTFLARLAPRIAETVQKFFSRVMEGTGALRDLPNGIGIVGLSLLSWVVQIAMVALTARALDIRLDPIASSAILLIINLGLSIPVAPGNIGTFQCIGIIALSLFSIEKTEALAFSIVLQVVQGAPVVLGGCLSVLFFAARKKRNAKSAPHDARALSESERIS